MLVLQLFGLGHLIFVTHAICEHGDLLHADVAARRAEEARAAFDRGIDDGASHAERGRAAEDHQHCDALAVRPAVVSVAPAFDAPADLGTALPPSIPPAAAGHAPIALLSLAPKVSPPARAASSKRAASGPTA